jgi:hypothetical protein
VRAVEMRHDKPIFYAMGDFVFEIENVARLPVEAYERVGLGDDATPEDIFRGEEGRRPPHLRKPGVFEGFVAVLSIAGKSIQRIRLLPVDLQFNGPTDRRGRPQIAAPETGRRIVESVAALSRRYGTQIRYHDSDNCGVIDLA